MKKKHTIETVKKEWIKPIFIAIIAAVIISLLWGIGAPIFDWLQETVFKITTLGLSSLSDSFYRSVAWGFHEEASIWNFILITTILIMLVKWEIIGGFQVKNKIEDINKALENKLEEYKKLPPEEAEVLIQKACDEYKKNYEKEDRRIRRNRRFWISFKVAFLVFMLLEYNIIGRRNNAIARFHRLFTFTKIVMDEDEEELILAQFSAIHSKQDYFDIMNELSKKIVPAFEKKNSNKKATQSES